MANADKCYRDNFKSFPHIRGGDPRSHCSIQTAQSLSHTRGGDPTPYLLLQGFRKEVTPMQLIHELSWLCKGIGIIALASAMVFIAAFKLHKEEYKN